MKRSLRRRIGSKPLATPQKLWRSLVRQGARSIREYEDQLWLNRVKQDLEMTIKQQVDLAE